MSGYKTTDRTSIRITLTGGHGENDEEHRNRSGRRRATRRIPTQRAMITGDGVQHCSKATL